MTLQTKIIGLYFIVAFCCIITHYSASAQHVIPDADLKTNVSSITNSLDYIKVLQPKRFEYDRSKFNYLNLPTGKFHGFLAEEFRQVLPYMISYKPYTYTVGKNAQKTITTQEVDLEKLVPLLVGAIKEQQTQIEQLQAEITELRQQIQQQ